MVPLKHIYTIRKAAILFLSVSFSFIACSKKGTAVETENTSAPVSVIFDTDIGNDIDDALALDMIYKYIDRDKFRLLGIMTNKDNYYSPEYIDVMNEWYGYPHIPIGIWKKGELLHRNDTNYTTHACIREENGQYVFRRTMKNYDLLPNAALLYRKLLAQQPDSSVTIISVGFSTNLARLLEIPADEYSPLNGTELVKSKVKLLSVMAGSFSKEDYVEFNVYMDPPAARAMFAGWPGEIVVSPFELGERILYPGESIENDFTWTKWHPLVEAYKAFGQMPYDRPTWDLTSVLYVAEPDSNFFHLSGKGQIRVDEKGCTHFTPQEDGKHRYLITTPEQEQRIRDYFVSLIPEKPLHFGKQ
ncbi:MAG: nucleoside hydrolase [Candidatus Azobacteroides sp.]|nr:nucleoside hydrolase [Candidatus Azobacteroides sp.]